MSINELNEILRGIPAERMGRIELEYIDTSLTDQFGDECFNGAKEVRLIVEQTGEDEYSYKLRIV